MRYLDCIVDIFNYWVMWVVWGILAYVVLAGIVTLFPAALFAAQCLFVVWVIILGYEAVKLSIARFKTRSHYIE